ncbi:acyltransferase family protein [Acidobacteriota bacterium]
MPDSKILNDPIQQERLLSLDVFRGLTMLLLIAEFTHFFSFLVDSQLEGTILHAVGQQFHHHPWNGLRFWDLIQPFFMFIVGVALPFSFRNRTQRGDSYSLIRNHAVKRAFLLLFLGWALYCIGPGQITWRFQNVLAQLAVTYTIAFFLMKRSTRTQIFASIALLGFSELLYRCFPVSGFNLPFTPDQNFGAYVDLLISGELSSGHWVSFNAIPTAAHTIWGVLVGQLLLSGRREKNKLKILIYSGISILIAGYALNFVTPIIKRISTTSFVLASGGWTILVLALFYWFLDVKKMRRGWLFFAVVGMNPLFIYLFSHIGGADLVFNVIKPFTFGVFGWTGILPAKIFTSAVVWFFLWYICFWMHKRRIYIRI